MVRIRVWEKSWNKRRQYEQTHLKCRETIKENKVIPIVEHLTSDSEEISIVYLWGIVGKQYNIHTDKYVINLNFVSDKQQQRFREYMEKLNGGEIEEKYCR